MVKLKFHKLKINVQKERKTQNLNVRTETEKKTQILVTVTPLNREIETHIIILRSLIYHGYTEINEGERYKEKRRKLDKFSNL